MKSCMADGGGLSGDGFQEQSPESPDLHMLIIFWGIRDLSREVFVAFGSATTVALTSTDITM